MEFRYTKQQLAQHRTLEAKANSLLGRRSKAKRKKEQRQITLARKYNKNRHRAYISSVEWKERRALYFSTHTKACMVCGAYRDIHLHHMTYEAMGHEPDEHLIALCDRHHKAYHLEKRSPSIASTLAFVEKYKTV